MTHPRQQHTSSSPRPRPSALWKRIRTKFKNAIFSTDFTDASFLPLLLHLARYDGVPSLMPLTFVWVLHRQQVWFHENFEKSKKSIFSNSDKANRAHKGRYSLVYAHYASSIPITHAYLMFRGNLQTFSLYPHFFSTVQWWREEWRWGGADPHLFLSMYSHSHFSSYKKMFWIYFEPRNDIKLEVFSSNFPRNIPFIIRKFSYCIL